MLWYGSVSNVRGADRKQTHCRIQLSHLSSGKWLNHLSRQLMNYIEIRQHTCSDEAGERKRGVSRAR